MKLKAYLVQENKITVLGNLEVIKNQIEKFCQPYLKELGTSVDPKKPQFYRGMYAGTNSFIKREVRQDRVPSGMDSDIFWGFNEWLKKKGGANRKKSLICTGDKSWAEDFGHPYMIYPIGKLKYSWIYARDVNIPALTTGYTPGFLYMLWAGGEEGEEFAADMIYRELNKRPPSKEKWMSFAKELTKEWFKKKGVINNKGLHIAQKKEYETWFECKEYYAVKLG